MNTIPNKDGCYKISERDQCCCQCTNHKPTFYHCTTNMFLRHEIEKITKKPTCICSVQSGWACRDPLTGNIYPNWEHHSIGCEMFVQKKEK